MCRHPPIVIQGLIIRQSITDGNEGLVLFTTWRDKRFVEYCTRYM
jgi:hypothetical protein